VTRAALERVERLLEGARRIRDAGDALGAEARAVLPRSTGLSKEGTELALSRCLEVSPTRAELEALVHAAGAARRAWVLLSANVFVAAHRAVALALASSPDVRVRPSRRAPEMARLLRAATGELFQIVEDLAPGAGDHVWAYGSDETMRALRERVPPSVVVHPHGAGIGIAAVTPEGLDDLVLDDQAERLAGDVVLFDQRGCLSPRVVLSVGSPAATERFAARLAGRLGDWEAQVPRGVLDPDEAAGETRYRQTMRFSGELLPAGSGSVGVDVRSGRVVVPPPGRNVHVVRVEDPGEAIASVSALVAAIGSDDPRLRSRLGAIAPGARCSGLGAMQTPPFDGPVDLRGQGR
jgi:hypothetical protein